MRHTSANATTVVGLILLVAVVKEGQEYFVIKMVSYAICIIGTISMRNRSFNM